MKTKTLSMTGAESLLRTLSKCGVDVCFANPGTTEMYLVQAIDSLPQMRAILCLFEGVCTGAADGFGRMTGRPATTLLHLGAGLGNGMANLHNARRARTPIINLVGNHASYHLKYDAPLTSDIDSLAHAVSCWYKSDSTAESLASDGADAMSATLTPTPDSKGQIATLIVGTDAASEHVTKDSEPNPTPSRPTVSSQSIDQAALSLDADSMLIVDGPGASSAGLEAAARIAAVTGCQLCSPFSPARIDGGTGRPSIKRLPYFPKQMLHELSGVKKLVLAGAKPPVSFFAYTHVPSCLVPEGCKVIPLASVEEDVVGALEAVADSLNASSHAGKMNARQIHDVPGGALSAASASAIIANRVPEGCIIAVDSGSGNNAFDALQTALPNTWLSITGGSIGQGGPVAIGAAVACPDRQVLTLQGDGGAMYTNQSFWTQAREGLNVTTVIYSNREYWILDFEYLRLGLPELSQQGKALFSLENPSIDWVELAGSMGVPGCRARTAEEFDSTLARSFAEPGPFVIEAEVASPKREDLAWLIPKREQS
jgi:acetolactate synthase-1/2/3 large subunit